MSGIRQPIEDVLTRIRAELPQFLTVRVWNNQVDMERDGRYQAYLKPACFLEVLNDVVWEQLSEGFSAADLGFRFHIVHEYYDDQAGNFEQDLPVFDLRDAVIKAFMLYKPVGCGHMTKINEVMDYDHDNIYHLLVDFVAHFIDDKGAKEYIEKEPPTDLELTATFSPPKNYLITP
jgi:hypothetical protein